MKFLLTSCALIILLGLLGWSQSEEFKIKFFNHKHLFTAIYPLHNLKEGIELLDPQNTNTVWEYYLLENISCGLVRDSKNSSTGYVGCVAEQFYQRDPQTWLFKIRKLSWSDGTPVTKIEIEDWMQRLRTNDSRHIQFLKKASKITFDEVTRELEIHFPTPVTDSVLHELSLADAGLFPTNFKATGWGKTVGPYTVKAWQKNENFLILTANINSPLYEDQMPKEVELRSLIDPKIRTELFKSIDVDLVPLNAMSNSIETKELLLNAPQVYECHPTTTLYFVLNKRNPLSHKIDARKDFAHILEKVRKNLEPLNSNLSSIKTETQMIPEGFEGRISDFNPASNPIHTLTNMKLKIRLFFFLEDNYFLVNTLKEGFKKFGVDLEIQFSKSFSAESDDEFASLASFVGNQRDPAGSWSFLLYSAKGALHPWLENLSHEFKRPSDHSSNQEKQDFYVRLHKTVLANSFVVPFLIGGERYLLSKRVDASGWNRFDARIRFYELKMR